LERALVISSKLRNINKVRKFLRQVYHEACLNMNSFNRVFLGISEAVNNAILHGNQLNPEKKVFIRMVLKGNQFKVEVEDEGEGFKNEFLADPTLPENLKREHGRGLFLLKQLAGELFFEKNGRRIIIKFMLPE